MTLLDFQPPQRNTLRRGCAALGLLFALVCGCGTTRQNAATEQLLLSDAVDRSVARIDFAPLTGRKVYLDTQYIQPSKTGGFVNSDYIISSIRQQMVAARCLLQERRDDAEYVCEARVGALGSDGHDVSYGIPANSTLNSAMTLVPNTPALPAIPELSIAKRTEDLGAAKIAVFAYHRESREPYWQSGISQARSTAKFRWILGAGPFQSGSIYQGTRFAGRKLNVLESSNQERINEQSDAEFRTAAVWSLDAQDNAAATSDQQIEALLADSPAAESPTAMDKPLSESPPLSKRSAVRVANHEEPAPPEPPGSDEPPKKIISGDSEMSPPADSSKATRSPLESTTESTNHTGLEPAGPPFDSAPPAGWLDSFRRFGTRVNGIF